MTALNNYSAVGGDPILGDFYSEAALAAELGVCARTLKRWRAMREAPPVTRIGRRVMFRRAAVERWLAARQVELE